MTFPTHTVVYSFKTITELRLPVIGAFITKSNDFKLLNVNMIPLS